MKFVAYASPSWATGHSSAIFVKSGSKQKSGSLTIRNFMELGNINANAVENRLHDGKDFFLRHQSYHEQITITQSSIKQGDNKPTSDKIEVVTIEKHQEVNSTDTVSCRISHIEEKPLQNSCFKGGPDEEDLLMEISIKPEPIVFDPAEPEQENDMNDLIDIGEVKIEPGVKLEKPKTFQCDICFKLCDSKDKLKRHKRIVHGPKIHNCIPCKFETTLRRDLRKHLRTKLHFKTLHEQADDASCVNWIYDGKETGSEPPSKDDLPNEGLEGERLANIKKEEEKTNESNSENDLKQAAEDATVQDNELKKEEGQFKCDICNKTFPPDKKELLDHKWSAHGYSKHKCPICGRAYIYRFRMIQHMRIHETHTEHLRGKRKVRVKSLSCDLCPRKFTIERSLEAHKKRNHGLSPHVCHLCKRTFAYPCELKDHLQLHLGNCPVKKQVRRKKIENPDKPPRKRGRPKKVVIKLETPEPE